VFYAGWLGHYVADGAQPLHTTIHYNGWAGPNPNGYTTRPGIHSQFESIYVAQNISARDFANLVHSPDRIAEPFERYVAYLKESNRLVEKVYELEKAGALSGKGSAEAFDFTTRRLAAGAQMLLDLWYTAWLESASDPEPVRPSAAFPESRKAFGNQSYHDRRVTHRVRFFPARASSVRMVTLTNRACGGRLGSNRPQKYARRYQRHCRALRGSYDGMSELLHHQCDRDADYSGSDYSE
jgi:hypothetical protein